MPETRPPHPPAGVGRSRARALLYALVLAGAGLRLYDLGTKSLWRDEIETLLFASAPLGDTVRWALQIPFIPIPPLYFLLTHPFLALGDSPAVLRLPAALASIASLLLIYVLGRRWFGERTALAAVFLMAVSPFQVYYAQEGRSYAFLMMLALASLLLMERCLEGGWTRFAPWGAALLAILYTHHFGALVIASEALALPLLFFIEGGWRRPGRRRFVLLWLGTLAAVALLWYPIMSRLLAAASGARGVKGLALAPAFSTEELGTMVGLMGLGTSGIALLIPALALLGLAAWSSRERRGLVTALLWLAPGAFAMLFGRYGHVFRVRYLIFVIPVYLLLAARGLRVLDAPAGRLLARLRPRSARGFGAPAATLVFSLLAAAYVLPYYQGYYLEEKQNWKAAAAFLAREAGPGDVVVVTGRGEDTNLHAFVLDYYEGLGPRTEILHPAGDYRGELEALLQSGRRLWYVSTDPRDPELREQRHLFRGERELVEAHGYAVLPPLAFGTGTRLTSLETEFLALSRFKPVKVTPVLPGLAPAQAGEEFRRLVAAARSIPRGYVVEEGAAQGKAD